MNAYPQFVNKLLLSLCSKKGTRTVRVWLSCFPACQYSSSRFIKKVFPALRFCTSFVVPHKISTRAFEARFSLTEVFTKKSPLNKGRSWALATNTKRTQHAQPYFGAQAPTTLVYYIRAHETVALLPIYERSEPLQRSYVVVLQP